MDINIKVLNNSNQKNFNIHKNLMKPPFILLLNAQRKSGKTNVILNILQWYMKIFDNIMIVCPTFNAPSSYSEWYKKLDKKTKKKIIILLIPDFNKIQLFYEFQQMANTKKETHGLIIFDDCMDYLKKGNITEPTITNLVTTHRHPRISLIFSSQYLNMTPPVIRTNMSALIIFKLNSNEEMEKLKRYISTGSEVDWPEFLKIYSYAIEPQYKGDRSFLYINYEFPDSEMYHKKFGEKIIVKNTTKNFKFNTELNYN